MIGGEAAHLGAVVDGQRNQQGGGSTTTVRRSKFARSAATDRAAMVLQTRRSHIICPSIHGGIVAGPSTMPLSRLADQAGLAESAGQHLARPDDLSIRQRCQPPH